MTAEEFRKMALSLPQTVEAAHMGHPDFRVGGKIFATLSPPGAGLGNGQTHARATGVLCSRRTQGVFCFQWSVGTRRGNEGASPLCEEDHSARCACLRLAK